MEIAKIETGTKRTGGENRKVGNGTKAATVSD
jgi:hypothetical protein